MSKRREGDLSGRDVGLIGEHREKVSGYESPMWEAVNKMVEGHMPTTNLATIAAGARHGSNNEHMYKKGGHVGHRSVENEQRRMVEGERARHGGHMKHNDEPPRHKKHHEGHSKHHKKHFAAGGVGKVRKDQY